MSTVGTLPFQTYTHDDICELQLADPILQLVYSAVQKGQPPTDVVSSWDRGSRLLMQQGVLYRKALDGNGKEQLVLSTILHSMVLKDLHEGAVSGHVGEEKMLGLLRERFFWPGCTGAVRSWCKSCVSCATRKSPTPKSRAGLQTIVTGYPMQIVCVDIMGPLPETQDGNKYVLVAADYFKKWVEAYGIPNQEALTVASKLVDDMFCRFSPPEQLYSNQGHQFESELVKEVCSLLQIRKTRTTPYIPQCNGMVERFNRTLLSILSTTVGNNPSNWEIHIRKVCFAYNSSRHSTTGYSPFFLMFGRQATLPVDLMYPLAQSPKKSVPEYVQQMKESLWEAYATVRQNCQSEHCRKGA